MEVPILCSTLDPAVSHRIQASSCGHEEFKSSSRIMCFTPKDCCLRRERSEMQKTKDHQQIKEPFLDGPKIHGAPQDKLQSPASCFGPLQRLSGTDFSSEVADNEKLAMPHESSNLSSIYSQGCSSRLLEERVKDNVPVPESSRKDEDCNSANGKGRLNASFQVCNNHLKFSVEKDYDLWIDSLCNAMQHLRIEDFALQEVKPCLELATFVEPFSTASMQKKQIDDLCVSFGEVDALKNAGSLAISKNEQADLMELKHEMINEKENLLSTSSTLSSDGFQNLHLLVDVAVLFGENLPSPAELAPKCEQKKHNKAIFIPGGGVPIPQKRATRRSKVIKDYPNSNCMKKRPFQLENGIHHGHAVRGQPSNHLTKTAAPLIRSSRGRAQVLPSWLQDSVLELKTKKIKGNSRSYS